LEHGFDLSSIVMDENMSEPPQLLNASGDVNESIAQLEVQDELEQSEESIAHNLEIEEIGEDLLWHQVAQELERQHHMEEVETQRVREEEEDAAKEIIKEEENVVCAVTTKIGKVWYLKNNLFKK
jgi:hypothetical protein